MLELLKTIEKHINYQGGLNVNSLIKSIENNPQEFEKLRQAFDAPYTSDNRIDKKELASYITNRFNENQKMRNEVYRQIEELLKEMRHDEAELMAYKHIGAVKYNQLASLSQRYFKKYLSQKLEEFGIKELIESGDFKSADERAQSFLKGALMEDQYSLTIKRIGETKADQMLKHFDTLVREKRWSEAKQQSEEISAYLANFDTQKAEMLLKRYNAIQKEFDNKYYHEIVEKVEYCLQKNNFEEAEEIYKANKEVLKSFNYKQLREEKIKQYNTKKAKKIKDEIMVLLPNDQFEEAEKLFCENKRILKGFNYEQIKKEEVERYNKKVEKELIKRIKKLFKQHNFDEADHVYVQNLTFLKEFDYEKHKSNAIESSKNKQRNSLKKAIKKHIFDNELIEANRLYDDNQTLLVQEDYHKEKKLFFNEINDEKKKKIKNEILTLITNNHFNEAHKLYLLNNEAISQYDYWKSRNEAYQRYKSIIRESYQNALASGDFIEAERLFNVPELSINKQQHQYNIEKHRRKYANRVILESREKIQVMDAGTTYNRSSIMKIVDERRIKHLVHFTKADNLPSILQHGLVPVKLQETFGVNTNKNDPMRYDQIITATSLSVDFPNYKVFYKFRTELYQDDMWVIIKLKPSVLVSEQNKSYFCQTNAANINNRKLGYTHEAFNSMFAETIITKERKTVQREDLPIPDNWTTDPQAEILVDGIIDTCYIDSIVFRKKDHRDSLFQKEHQKIIKDFKVEINSELFSCRQDYQLWQSNSKENQYGEPDLFFEYTRK